MKVFLKNSNLRDHDTSTSQTDRQTDDMHSALCSFVQQNQHYSWYQRQTAGTLMKLLLCFRALTSDWQHGGKSTNDRMYTVSATLWHIQHVTVCHRGSMHGWRLKTLDSPLIIRQLKRRLNSRQKLIKLGIRKVGHQRQYFLQHT